MYNYLGIYTLYIKEVKRFLKVYNQTLLAPIVTSLLFLIIFYFAFSASGIKKVADSISYLQFIAAGIIMMGIMQNSFANTSSTIIASKMLGYIVDFLVPPITPIGLIIALILATVTRGLIIGILNFVILVIFIDFDIHSFSLLFIYPVLTSIALGFLGLMTGIIANSFDQTSAITSYIITPLSFLSGTFYSVKILPEFWYNITIFNPFFLYDRWISLCIDRIF